MAPEIVAIPERYALTAKATCNHKELGPIIGGLFGSLMERYPEAELLYPPCLFYLQWREDDCDIEAAVFIDPLSLPGEALKTYPAQRAAVHVHIGPYEKLHESWAILWQQFKEAGLTTNEQIWDCYVTDPGEEPDPAKWETELYIGIQ